MKIYLILIISILIYESQLKDKIKTKENEIEEYKLMEKYNLY